MTVMDKINRLTKWKMVFAGWQLGTRPVGDPECDAVRDHREVTILLRAEITTLLALSLRKVSAPRRNSAKPLAQRPNN